MAGYVMMCADISETFLRYYELMRFERLLTWTFERDRIRETVVYLREMFHSLRDLSSCTGPRRAQGLERTYPRIAHTFFCECFISDLSSAATRQTTTRLLPISAHLRRRAGPKIRSVRGSSGRVHQATSLIWVSGFDLLSILMEW